MLKFLNFSVKFIIVFFIAIILFAFSTLWYFSIGLPDYKKLSNYQPPISSRVYSEDGKLIAEYAIQKRLFVPYDSIPEIVEQIAPLTNAPLVHFSGALSSEKLSGKAFSMHPLYTFNYEPMTLNEYQKIPFTCEPNGPDFSTIFPSLRNPHVKIPNSNRRLYHSLACLASNLPAMIWTQCAEISSDNLNLDWKLYQPLVEQTLRNAFSAPKDCITGPIIRGDWNLVDAQLEVLPKGTATNMYELAARNSKESQ